MVTQNPQLGTQGVQNTINSLGQNKKAVAIGAIVLTVVLTLAILIFSMSSNKNLGDQIDLVKGIDQGRAFEIVSTLKGQEIESKIIDGETPGKVVVTVFEKQFDKAALALARSDLLQEDGFGLFDKTDWAASDYDKRVKMTRAVNGDLSRIISRTTGVKWATVRINIPEQELFSQYESPTTATVQVEPEKDHGQLSKSQVKSIINLLIGYVPNLDRKNISVVDTSGRTYSAVEDHELAADEIMEETEKVNKVIQTRIEEYLTPLLGPNNFIVRVSSEVSREKIESNATTFTDGTVGQEQIGDERVGGGGNESIRSLATVGPPSPNSVSTTTTQSSSAYSKTNKVIQRYPSYEQKSVSTPPGKISNIKVAVAINRGVPPSVSIKQLQEGVAAIASPSSTSNDVKITVAEFYGNSPTASKKTSAAGAFSAISAENISGMFTGIPMWAKVGGSLIVVLIGLNLLGALFSGGKSQQSTLSQINQSRRPAQGQTQQFEEPKQLSNQEIDRPIRELPEFKQQITPQERPDISRVLNGLEEAAAQKPEFVANRLQLWLEEGSKLQ